jgi:hypothetical protein
VSIVQIPVVCALIVGLVVGAIAKGGWRGLVTGLLSGLIGGIITLLFAPPFVFDFALIHSKIMVLELLHSDVITGAGIGGLIGGVLQVKKGERSSKKNISRYPISKEGLVLIAVAVALVVISIFLLFTWYMPHPLPP